MLELEHCPDPSSPRAIERDHEARAIAPLAADMLQPARHYDITAMNRVLAVCFWGRSGSFLLASYLDGHPDTIVPPALVSEAIYVFFEEHTGLSVWQKLRAYPQYAAARNTADGNLFEGDYAIEASRYYAAVHALQEIHRDEPAAWLSARANFFRLVYVAYAVARGDRAASSSPLMVYAQHVAGDITAMRLVEDFPAAQFVHTIRDPISAVDSWFDRVLQLRTRYSNPSSAGSPLMSPALDAMTDILSCDRPHREMDERSRAIRFEDLHQSTAATMRGLAAWLGVAEHPCLVESTWNGRPWIVSVRGARCCGANPDNARRRSKYLNAIDRLRIFALLNENFSAWRYAAPAIVRWRPLRWCISFLLLPLPMKMEWVTIGWVMRYQVIPDLRRRRWIIAIRAPAFLLKRRWRMMTLIAAQTRARMMRRRSLLKVLEPDCAKDSASAAMQPAAGKQHQ